MEETGVTTPTGVVEEFDRTVHEELDFSHEARNAQLMADAAAGRDFVLIPKVHAALSCATVLTLDYVEGVKVSDITAADGHDLEQVARNVLEASFRQLFEDGVFHGDPHPGNILVRPDNRIALLDFGLVGRLSRGQQEVAGHAAGGGGAAGRGDGRPGPDAHRAPRPAHLASPSCART